MGRGKYARGDRALGLCERCSKKMLLRKMVYDGQYNDLLVCPSCWDPKHPQEYLPEVHDPITLMDPTGDQDKEQASMTVISFPRIRENGTDRSFLLGIDVILDVSSYNASLPNVEEEMVVTGGVFAPSFWAGSFWADSFWSGT